MLKFKAGDKVCFTKTGWARKSKNIKSIFWKQYGVITGREILIVTKNSNNHLIYFITPSGLMTNAYPEDLELCAKPIILVRKK